MNLNIFLIRISNFDFNFFFIRFDVARVGLFILVFGKANETKRRKEKVFRKTNFADSKSENRYTHIRNNLQFASI